MESFYSNGKLLLSGEYAILDGALGLAIPTKFGQSLSISENNTQRLQWKSYDEKGSIWFEGVFEPETLLLTSNSDAGIGGMLSKILAEARNLNSIFLNGSKGGEVETRLDFPRNWGLGSSSTLINNIAQWADVDAFELQKKAFGGSGYDIACAQNDRPIIYRSKDGNQEIRQLNFNPDFKNHLYFVHLNKKQNSREEISKYSKQHLDKAVFVKKISKLTERISTCEVLADFQDLLNEHEDLLSRVLNRPKIKNLLFEDFDGGVKSLGAWGGDFVLAVGDESTPDYFKKKGYETTIPFVDMLL